MKKAFVGLVAVFLMVGCVSTRYVPVETIRTEYKTKEVHDSIFIEIVKNDSMAVNTKGDTTEIHHWHTEWRDRWRDKIVRDTVFRNDSVQVPYPVPAMLTVWQSFCCDYGKIMLGCTILLLVFVIIYIYRKLRASSL